MRLPKAGAVLIAGLVCACSSGSTGDQGATGAPAPSDLDGLACWTAPASGAGGEITFDDVTADYGLVEPLAGMYGHAAAWGDIDSNGSPDLFVGTFADRPEDDYQHRGASGPAPDRMLRFGGGSFQVDDFPEVRGRTSGAVFADLDADGELDLVVARNPRDAERQTAPTTAYVNRGQGRFESVEDSGIDPLLGGRSIGVLDYDGNGLLDLFIVEDIYEGGSSRLYRNLGDFRFEDATSAAGLPLDISGLGLATGDVNNDGRTDLFVGGSNRLFTGDGQGFAEVSSDVFEWDTYGEEDLVAGAVFGDVNRDGWLDLVVGHHFNSTVDDGQQVPVRLYLNRTTEPAETPEFVDVTDAAGLVGLPTKAPDLALADLDNDGWPDLVTTASADDGHAPAVFRHSGDLVDGIPQFTAPAGLGDPQYWISGPLADVDHDGRLDLLLVEWEPALPSLLLHNTSAAGHWIAVSVGAQLGGGIGTRVTAFEAGGAGDLSRLLASGEIVASAGYTSGREQMLHLGLGAVTEIDLEVSVPGHSDIVLRDQPVDRYLRLPDGC